MAASAAPIRSERLAAYRRLTRRNRIVDVLRIVVPLAGVAVFVGLALQIYVTNTARQYGIAGIRVDRDGYQPASRSAFLGWDYDGVDIQLVRN